MRIIVLGAGVVGVTGAWYLACAGHEVTVIDRRPEPGMETSFANGGQISAGHAEPWASPSVIPKLLRWLGREDAPLLFRPRADLAQWQWGLRFMRECLPGRFESTTRMLAGLAIYSRDRLKELRAQTDIEYDHLDRGILNFCTDAAEFAALTRHVEAMKGNGIRREVLSAAQCLEVEPALKATRVPIVGGVLTPGDESGDAHAFTQCLARLAAARGVKFLMDSTIEALEAQGSRVTGVRLAGGAHRRAAADAFVVSLGSFSARLLRPLGIRIPVYPLKGYSITVPLTEDRSRHAPTVSLGDEERRLVISRLGKRLRVAGTAELNGYDTSVNKVRCDAILQRTIQLFPGLAQTKGVEYWAGLRPATPNNAPLIGHTRYANVFLNTGHGTLGWTLACGSGRALADIVSGRRPEVDYRFS